MTDIEGTFEDALCTLGNVRGSLMLVVASGANDPPDYFGLSGQKNTTIAIAQTAVDDLAGVIKSLEEVAPKEDAGGKVA